mgnify:CR=1 FL=1
MSFGQLGFAALLVYVAALAGIAEWDAREAVAVIRYYIDRL